MLVLGAAAWLAGCGSERESLDPVAQSALTAPAQAAAETGADTADTAEAPPGRWAERYYEGYLAEALASDVAGARRAYEDVIAGAGAQAPAIAARAALRLAELEALAGHRRNALELMARASVLGRDDIEVVEQAEHLKERLGSLRADGSEVSGPPLGTTLPAVSAEAAARFARAEELLGAYHRTRLMPRLEALGAGVRAKESAMDAAVRAYRSVVALNEPAATVAAEFRAGSLYHDLALSLMFDLPPELEPHAAARVRRSLRASAISYLRKAREAYRRSLEAGSAAADTGEQPDSERWLAAAALGLGSARDLLSDE